MSTTNPRPSEETQWRARAMVSRALRAHTEGEWSIQEAVVTANLPGRAPCWWAALESGANHEQEVAAAAAVAERLELLQRVLPPWADW